VRLDKGPVYLKDIARAGQMSEKYLSQLVLPLRSAGLVNTFRGAKGGYVLGKNVSEITLADIVEAMEGDMSLLDCAKNKASCRRSDICVSRDVWVKLGDMIRGFLEQHSLEEMVNKCVKKKDTIMDYSI